MPTTICGPTPSAWQNTMNVARRAFPHLLCLLLWPSNTPNARAWWEPGHRIIAELAFDRLSIHDQRSFLDLLREHPRYAQDFMLPVSIEESTTDADRWRWGTAAYWPDIARQFPVWHRPQWHYQLGATRVLGASKDLKVPSSPAASIGPEVTMRSQDIYIAQAIGLCLRVLQDPSRPRPERALALCWILHLGADAHQPCHAGSLYAHEWFPEGDRGANLISVGERWNLHALWDAQLGTNAEPHAVRMEVNRIRFDPLWHKEVLAPKRSQDPAVWLKESRQAAQEYVYDTEVMRWLSQSSPGTDDKMQIPDLSDRYYRQAAQISRARAIQSALRLVTLLQNAVLDLR